MRNEAQQNPRRESDVIGAAHVGLLTSKATPRLHGLWEGLGLPTTSSDDGGDLVLDDIVEQHRRRCDIARARHRLAQQAMSFCRRCAGNDKDAGAKLWSDLLKSPEHPLRIPLMPYLTAMEPLSDAQAEIERGLIRTVRQLRIHPWAKLVKGLGDLSLAGIVGECVSPIGSYKSVAAVWKRMGLAVVDGERQKKMWGEAAEIHGYSPQRRALMWNVGVSLIRAQVRRDPNGSSVATGRYGQLYLDRKAYEAEKLDVSPLRAHRRAQRYIEKRLLRDLYVAWNRASGEGE